MAVLHLKAKPDSRTGPLPVGPGGTGAARLAALAHNGRPAPPCKRRWPPPSASPSAT